MNRNELAKLVKKHPGLRKIMAEAALPPSVINRLIAEEVMEEGPRGPLASVKAKIRRALNTVTVTKLSAEERSAQKGKLDAIAAKWQAQFDKKAITHKQFKELPEEDKTKALSYLDTRLKAFSAAINVTPDTVGKVDSEIKKLDQRDETPMEVPASDPQPQQAANPRPEKPENIVFGVFAAKLLDKTSENDPNPDMGEIGDFMEKGMTKKEADWSLWHLKKALGRFTEDSAKEKLQKYIEAIEGDPKKYGKEDAEDQGEPSETGQRDQAKQLATKTTAALEDKGVDDPTPEQAGKATQAVAANQGIEDKEVIQAAAEQVAGEETQQPEQVTLDNLNDDQKSVLQKFYAFIIMGPQQQNEQEKPAQPNTQSSLEQQLEKFSKSEGVSQEEAAMLKSLLDNSDIAARVQTNLKDKNWREEFKKKMAQQKEEPKEEPASKEEFKGEFDHKTFKVDFEAFKKDFMRVETLSEQAKLFTALYNHIKRYLDVDKNEFDELEQQAKAFAESLHENEAPPSLQNLQLRDLDFIQRTVADIQEALEEYQKVATKGVKGSRALYSKYRGRLGADAGNPKKVLYKLLLKDAAKTSNAFISKIESMGVTIQEAEEGASPDIDDLSFREQVRMVREAYNTISNRGEELIASYSQDLGEGGYVKARAAAEEIWKAMGSIRALFPTVNPFKTIENMAGVISQFQSGTRQMMTIIGTMKGQEKFADVTQERLAKLAEALGDFVKLIKKLFAGDYEARETVAANPAGAQEKKDNPDAKTTGGDEEPPKEAEIAPDVKTYLDKNSDFYEEMKRTLEQFGSGALKGMQLQEVDASKPIAFLIDLQEKIVKYKKAVKNKELMKDKFKFRQTMKTYKALMERYVVAYEQYREGNFDLSFAQSPEEEEALRYNQVDQLKNTLTKYENFYFVVVGFQQTLQTKKLHPKTIDTVLGFFPPSPVMKTASPALKSVKRQNASVVKKQEKQEKRVEKALEKRSLASLFSAGKNAFKDMFGFGDPIKLNLEEVEDTKSNPRGRKKKKEKENKELQKMFDLSSEFISSYKLGQFLIDNLATFSKDLKDNLGRITTNSKIIIKTATDLNTLVINNKITIKRALVSGYTDPNAKPPESTEMTADKEKQAVERWQEEWKEITKKGHPAKPEYLKDPSVEEGYISDVKFEEGVFDDENYFIKFYAGKDDWDIPHDRGKFPEVISKHETLQDYIKSLGYTEFDVTQADKPPEAEVEEAPAKGDDSTPSEDDLKAHLQQFEKRFPGSTAAIEALGKLLGNPASIEERLIALIKPLILEHLQLEADLGGFDKWAEKHGLSDKVAKLDSKHKKVLSQLITNDDIDFETYLTHKYKWKPSSAKTITPEEKLIQILKPAAAKAYEKEKQENPNEAPDSDAVMQGTEKRVVNALNNQGIDTSNPEVEKEIGDEVKAVAKGDDSTPSEEDKENHIETITNWLNYNMGEDWDEMQPEELVDYVSTPEYQTAQIKSTLTAFEEDNVNLVDVAKLILKRANTPSDTAVSDDSEPLSDEDKEKIKPIIQANAEEVEKENPKASEDKVIDRVVDAVMQDSEFASLTQDLPDPLEVSPAGVINTEDIPDDILNYIFDSAKAEVSDEPPEDEDEPAREKRILAESEAAADKYNAELKGLLEFYEISPPDNLDGFRFSKPQGDKDAKWFLKEVDSTSIPSSDGRPQVWLIFWSNEVPGMLHTRVPIRDIKNYDSLDKWLTMNEYKKTEKLEEKNLREKLQQKLAPLIIGQ